MRTRNLSDATPSTPARVPSSSPRAGQHDRPLPTSSRRRALVDLTTRGWLPLRSSPRRDRPSPNVAGPTGLLPPSMHRHHVTRPAGRPQSPVRPAELSTRPPFALGAPCPGPLASSRRPPTPNSERLEGPPRPSATQTAAPRAQQRWPDANRRSSSAPLPQPPVCPPAVVPATPARHAWHCPPAKPAPPPPQTPSRTPFHVEQFAIAQAPATDGPPFTGATWCATLRPRHAHPRPPTRHRATRAVLDLRFPSAAYPDRHASHCPPPGGPPTSANPPPHPVPGGTDRHRSNPRQRPATLHPRPPVRGPAPAPRPARPPPCHRANGPRLHLRSRPQGTPTATPPTVPPQPTTQPWPARRRRPLRHRPPRSPNPQPATGSPPYPSSRQRPTRTDTRRRAAPAKPAARPPHKASRSRFHVEHRPIP